jgi:hypothetical protein
LVPNAFAAHVLADNLDTYTVATKFGNVFDTKSGDVTVVASHSHVLGGPRLMNVASVHRHAINLLKKHRQSRHNRSLIQEQSAVVAAGTNALRGDHEYVK